MYLWIIFAIVFATGLLVAFYMGHLITIKSMNPAVVKVTEEAKTLPGAGQVAVAQLPDPFILTDEYELALEKEEEESYAESRLPESLRSLHAES